MRVLIHCPFVLQTNTGITRYVLGLIRALASFDSTNEYSLLWPPNAPFPDLLPRNFHVIPLIIAGGGGEGHPLSRIVRETGFLRRVRRKFAFDVFHSPHSYLPFFVPTPTVLTLADLRVLRHPETFSRTRGLFLSRIIPYSLRRATIVAAMSQTTRAEVFALVKGVKENRVRVAYPGVDDRWFLPVDKLAVDALTQRLGLHSPFVLAVGTQEPHKNLPRLIEAFAQTRLLENPERQICLVGSTFSTGASDDVSQAISRVGVEGVTVTPGVLSDDELRGLYSRASLLAFPSLYEGFGYPPLEAMAVGTPVVTARASCLPEIVGDAAELVNPLAAGDIANGLLRVLTDDSRRSDLVGKGTRRVRRYTWQNHAGEMVQSYWDAANGVLSS